MIIDLILDRKDNEEFIRSNKQLKENNIPKNIPKNCKIVEIKEYNPRIFYNDIMSYGETGFGIASALDCGTENEVKAELMAYIVKEGYSIDICKYIISVNWL
jgi:hypothetical protein